MLRNTFWRNFFTFKYSKNLRSSRVFKWLNFTCICKPKEVSFLLKFGRKPQHYREFFKKIFNTHNYGFICWDVVNITFFWFLSFSSKILFRDVLLSVLSLVNRKEEERIFFIEFSRKMRIILHILRFQWNACVWNFKFSFLLLNCFVIFYSLH